MKIFQSTSAKAGSPGYAERSGQQVTVLRKLTGVEMDSEIGVMFRIQFRDGTMADAFADELIGNEE